MNRYFSFVFIFVLVLVVFVSGCVEENTSDESDTKFVCPDGSVVSYPTECDVGEETTTTEVTTTIIEDYYPLEIINNTIDVENNYFYLKGFVDNKESCMSIYSKLVAKFYKDGEIVEVSHEDLRSVSGEELKEFEIRFSKFDYDYYTIKASGECNGEKIYSKEINSTD